MAKILVADDDSGFRTMMRVALEDRGHTVLEAVDGDDCGRIIRQSEPDAVILDIFMPNKDGFEVLMEWQHHDQRPPFICVSGRFEGEGFDVLHLARKLGARHVLQKPFGLSEVMKLLA